MEQPCRVWTKARNWFGYGVRRVGARTQLVHRLAWEEAYGPIPAGMCVLHHCDVASCHEPSHLFLGTRSDNMRDKVEKNRQTRGSETGTAKLTEGAVVLMRLLHEHGYKYGPLAVRFGVTEAAVSMIVNRRRWAHI